jgi:hypothetical protein
MRTFLTTAAVVLALAATAPASTANALEVGETFRLNDKASQKQNWVWACDTLEEIRAANLKKCGTLVSSSPWMVYRKSDDAVCVKSPRSDKDACSWAVIPPDVLVTAKPSAPNASEEDQKTLDGLSGLTAYLQACNQWDKVSPVLVDNVTRLIDGLPFTMEQRRASLAKSIQMIKGIGVGRFCSEMAPRAASLLRTLEHIDWDRR